MTKPAHSEGTKVRKVRRPNRIELDGIGFGYLLAPQDGYQCIAQQKWTNETTRLKQYKKLNDWLTRAIEYMEQQS